MDVDKARELVGVVCNALGIDQSQLDAVKSACANADVLRWMEENIEELDYPY